MFFVKGEYMAHAYRKAIPVHSMSDIVKDRSLGHRIVMKNIPQLHDRMSPRKSGNILWTIDGSSLLVQSTLDLPGFHKYNINTAATALQITAPLIKSVSLPLPEELYSKGHPLVRGRKITVPEDERRDIIADRLRRRGFECDFVTVSAPQKAVIGRGTGSYTVEAFNIFVTGKVTNKDDFVQLIQTGFGRSKNYGFGMVQHDNNERI